MSRDITFDHYQEIAATTAIYPKNIALLYLGLKLCGEAGEVSEQIAKAYRDDNGIITPQRSEKLLKELGDVLWYLSETARQLNMQLSHVAMTNHVKLADRQRRGALKGEGDNR